MRYLGSASTETGIFKKTNQDSVCIKIAKFSGNINVAMAVLCDGMGGLEKGELASATVIRRCSDWFEKELPREVHSYSWQKLSVKWTSIVKEQNNKIREYGKRIGVNLGTTFTLLLIIEDKYMIIHVGDTRVYEIADSIKQLTEDQTFINREIKAGRMTIQEAASHPKRNMLLQCVGASREVNPEIRFGNVALNTVYMLCSDGFRHVISEGEIFAEFNPENVNSIEAMKQSSGYLIDVVKKRNERDNITVALLKCVK